MRPTKALRLKVAALRKELRSAALVAASEADLDAAAMFVSHEETMAEVEAALARLSMYEQMREKA